MVEYGESSEALFIKNGCIDHSASTFNVTKKFTCLPDIDLKALQNRGAYSSWYISTQMAFHQDF